MRAIPILAALLATIPFALAPAGASACPGGLQEMEDVGTVCPRENGLFEVFAPDMTSLGYIHGSDPVPVGPDVATEDVSASSAPTCVSGAPGTYYIQVIYARATDDTDGYAAWKPALRRLVNNSNAAVLAAAVATGSTASLHVKCVDGLVEVKNEVLPTLAAAASFSTITSDLRARGYNDGKVKYWVFYDDTGACTCGGQGNIYGDDRLTISNSNNGNAAAMFAITYGYDSTRIWLHELGHNLGAVQLSAPHASGGWHCNDGRDIMCYNDGGSNSSGYSNAYCSVEVWDCGKDSYFNAKPASTSYLARHWNIGSAIVRYLTLGAPSLVQLSCAPPVVELGRATTCTFTGYAATDVRYLVDWGDGTTEIVPASGHAPSGAQRNATHAYATAGLKDVVVTVSDANGAVGNSLTARIDVRADLTPPTLIIDEPVPSTLYRGCAEPIRLPHNARPLLVERGCVKATASDAGSGIARVEVWSQGSLVASGTQAPFVFEFDVPSSQLNTPLFVYAYDGAGNRAYATRSVDMVGLPG